MIECKNYIIKDFEPRYLEELSFEVLKFHRKVGVKYFSNCDSLRTHSQKIQSIQDDLNFLINSCDYNYCSFCSETNKLFQFCCFEIKNGVCKNPFIFKSQNFKLNQAMFQNSFDFFQRMKDIGYDEIHTIIDRKDPERYLKFLNKFYNIKADGSNPINAVFYI